jgi:hypothetical protein
LLGKADGKRPGKIVLTLLTRMKSVPSLTKMIGYPEKEDSPDDYHGEKND